MTGGSLEQEPKKEDTSPTESVSLEKRLYKTTKIAFTSWSGRSTKIYVMNTDGSRQKRLTNNPAFDGVSSWSPDGKKIAFVSNRDGNFEVYVMNADGSEQRNLTNNLILGDSCILWSPDGKKIAFVSTRNIPKDIILRRDAIDDICVMNADGSEQKNLTNSFTYGGASPSWSPDGKRIAFISKRDGNWEIYVMNADGTNQTRLTFNESKDTDPWRPNESSDVNPLWGPDGKKIAFRSYRDGNWEIYIMNADGSEQKNLTNNPGIDSDPSWSPDGKKITFMSRRDGDYEIYVMNVDGSEQKNLTKNIPGFYKQSPSWSPFLPLENKTNEKK